MRETLWGEGYRWYRRLRGDAPAFPIPIKKLSQKNDHQTRWFIFHDLGLRGFWIHYCNITLYLVSSRKIKGTIDSFLIYDFLTSFNKIFEAVPEKSRSCLVSLVSLSGVPTASSCSLVQLL